MALTPLEIQQRRFRTVFRGYDPREVEGFLEEAAAACEALQREVLRLTEELRRAQEELEDRRRREGTIKRALLHSQKVLDQMQENARQQAELIVAEARRRAGELVQQGQKRLAELQEAIAELRRQRVRLESEIAFVIDAHRRLLEAGREEQAERDGEDEKLKLFPPGA